ncbi:MAG: TraR/DksA family transcriptional regulator [Candidatus Komeilibacteria bacterium]
MLNKDFIEARKKDLSARKAELEEQLATLVNKDRQSSEYDSQFPDFGDKEDENAAEVAVYQGNISLEEDLKFSLERINQALQRIANNTYGTCEKCGQPIDEKRLTVFPQATACMNCKRKNI